jgi:hypothetical protein
MWPKTLSILASASLLVFSSVAPQAAEHVFTVRVQNVSVVSVLKLSNGSSEPFSTSSTPTEDRCLPPVSRAARVLRSWQKMDRLPPWQNHWRESLASSMSGCRHSSRSRPFATAPIGGRLFEFEVSGKPGERLTIATMLGQSNDLFYAPREEGIALFDGTNKPIAGDITSQILLWDAGTEINEEPRLGPNQPAFQAAPNTGPDEHGVVRPISEVKDRFHYPTVAEVLRVTITVGPTALR